jgi:hypothetical protein
MPFPLQVGPHDDISLEIYKDVLSGLFIVARTSSQPVSGAVGINPDQSPE